MMKIDKPGLMTVALSITILTVIIVSVTYFFVTRKMLIGPILIILGMISLIPVILSRISIRILKAEILFGVIDNGILAVFALSGAELFGILGAIVGSLVGNAVTDGIAGIFEGYEWQKTKKLNIKDNRTALTVAIGKLSGCLFGGGIVLTIVWTFLNIV